MVVFVSLPYGVEVEIVKFNILSPRSSLLKLVFAAGKNLI